MMSSITVPALLRARRGRCALVSALMIATALIEGLAVVMFVPLLGAIGGAGGIAATGWIGGGAARLIGASGIALSLGPLLAVFVALVASRAMLVHARELAQHRLITDIVDGLRLRAWDGLLHCDWRTLSALSRSDSAALLMTEIDRLGGGFGHLLGALASLLTLSGLAIAALVIFPKVAFAAIGGGVLVAALAGRFGGARAQGMRLGDATRAVQAAFYEGLGALRVIKSFGREARSMDAGAEAIARLRAAERRFLTTLGKGQLGLQTGGAVALALFVWLAVTRAGANGIVILPLVALALRALPLTAVLDHAWRNWTFARPALATIADLIARAEAAREPVRPAAPPLRRPERRIAVEDVMVRFAPRDLPAITAATLVLPTGSITALVGPSGAGKSTLADVFGGLVTPDRGVLAIDDVALGPAEQALWRRQVAYVQQEAWLAAASLRDNLRWADADADDARIGRALRAAAADFAFALPDGLDTRLGDGGRVLSGGERQRIVLARALLRDPALLILDEATSALDPVSEAAIARAVAALRGTMTILVIGHRGALTAIADRAVNVVDGRVVDRGP